MNTQNKSPALVKNYQHKHEKDVSCIICVGLLDMSVIVDAADEICCRHCSDIFINRLLPSNTTIIE